MPAHEAGTAAHASLSIMKQGWPIHLFNWAPSLHWCPLHCVYFWYALYIEWITVRTISRVQSRSSSSQLQTNIHLQYAQTVCCCCPVKMHGYVTGSWAPVCMQGRSIIKISQTTSHQPFVVIAPLHTQEHIKQEQVNTSNRDHHQYVNTWNEIVS